MSFFGYVQRNADRITLLTVQHVQVVLLSVAFATLIGVGLALATERAPRSRRILLALTGTLLTLPSFALFGLLIPVLGLGLAPTVVALTMYAIFPILRNTVTGLEGVDRRDLGRVRRVDELVAGAELDRVRPPDQRWERPVDRADPRRQDLVPVAERVEHVGDHGNVELGGHPVVERESGVSVVVGVRHRGPARDATGSRSRSCAGRKRFPAEMVPHHRGRPEVLRHLDVSVQWAGHHPEGES